MKILPTTKALARKTGVKWYYTGKPCKLGHVDMRLAANGNCYECNRIKALAYRAKYADRIKVWQDRNKDKNRAKKRVYDKYRRHELSSAIREAKKQDYLQNRERMAEKRKQWRIANPQKVLEYSRNRRARKKNAVGKCTSEQIAHLHALQKQKCASCFCCIASSYDVDHIVPLFRGGTNSIENIQLLCPRCNRSKSAKDPFDWARENGRLL